MKSLGLALTIFSLTGALAALDMSGAHRVEAANQDAVQLKAKAGAQRAVTSLTGHADKVEADSETNPAVIDAFLVVPRLTPQASRQQHTDRNTLRLAGRLAPCISSASAAQCMWNAKSA